MHEILPGIYRVLPSRPTDRKYISYLVVRAEGNLLFPCFSNQSTIHAHFDAIEELGGLAMQLLGDSHFKTAHCDEVAERFGAPLYCSEPEAPDVRASVHSVVTFPLERVELGPGVEAIPTPGHRVGGVCYLVQHRGARLLFAGDAIWHDGSDWHVYPSAKGRKKMLRSLTDLMPVEFDVLFCNPIVANEVYRRDFAGARERVEFLQALADEIGSA